MAASTDEDWVEKFIQQARNTIYKIVKLSGLSVYWEVNSKPISGSDVAETLKNFEAKVRIDIETLVHASSSLLDPEKG